MEPAEVRPDCLHPTDKGHADIAGAVLRVAIGMTMLVYDVAFETLEEIRDAVERCGDAPGIRSVVLTAAGSRFFSTGGDVVDYNTRYMDDLTGMRAYERAMERTFSEIMHCPKPVIHRVNGDVVGGATTGPVRYTVTVKKAEPSTLLTLSAGGIPQATVVTSPFFESGASVPVLTRRNAPVPYVHFASPTAKQAWPNRAACWSPASPAIGTSPPMAPSARVLP